MRVAFVGKGGAGKSSLAGTFARALAATGERVLALDSDSMPGLAFSLGVPRVDDGLPDEAFEEHDDGGRRRYRLRRGMSGTELVERYAVRSADGVYLLAGWEDARSATGHHATAFRLPAAPRRPAVQGQEPRQPRLPD